MCMTKELKPSHPDEATTLIRVLAEAHPPGEHPKTKPHTSRGVLLPFVDNFL